MSSVYDLFSGRRLGHSEIERRRSQENHPPHQEGEGEGSGEGKARDSYSTVHYEGEGLMRATSPSSRTYAKHLWNVKLPRLSDEVIDLCSALPADVMVTDLLCEYYLEDIDYLSDVVGRPSQDGDFFLCGRSGGWLGTDLDLTDDEIERVTDAVRSVVRNINSVVCELVPRYLDEYGIEHTRGNSIT